MRPNFVVFELVWGHQARLEPVFRVEHVSEVGLRLKQVLGGWKTSNSPCIATLPSKAATSRMWQCRNTRALDTLQTRCGKNSVHRLGVQKKQLLTEVGWNVSLLFFCPQFAVSQSRSNRFENKHNSCQPTDLWSQRWFKTGKPCMGFALRVFFAGNAVQWVQNTRPRHRARLSTKLACLGDVEHYGEHWILNRYKRVLVPQHESKNAVFRSRAGLKTVNRLQKRVLREKLTLVVPGALKRPQTQRNLVS